MNLQVEGLKGQVSALILPPCPSSCEAGSNPRFKFFFGKALDLKHTDLEDPERLDSDFLWFLGHAHGTFSGSKRRHKTFNWEVNKA